MRAARDQAAENALDAAKHIACWGARTFLEASGDNVETDVLARAIMAKIKTVLPEALEDAKEAFAVGMNNAAVETFRASIALAGVEAAKECVAEQNQIG
jgi:hypothetical protein